MKRHELSSMFGNMPHGDFKKLVADIKANGLLDDIVLWQGQVIDGWHRYKACLEAGVEPRFIDFDGDDYKAIAMVISRNERRRHLTPAAKVGIAKRVLGWHTKKASVGRSIGSRDPITEATVAEVAGVSAATVKRHTAIESKAPTLLAVVERGDMGLKTAVASIGVVGAEVMERAKPEEIKALAAVVGERLDVRIKRMLTAARELREHFALVSASNDDQATAACAEVRMVLGGRLFGELIVEAA